MKSLLRLLTYIVTGMLVIMAGTSICHAQLAPGNSVPIFSLKDIEGKIYDLSAMKDKPMVIVYFFDVESRPSQEGLLDIDQLAKKYKDSELVVWGITRSSRGKVVDFIAQTKPIFPILLDDAGVSDKYQAQLILPTICIVGPELRLLDFFQGGGKTTSVMLVRLAERKLQQKQTRIAQAISDEVIKKNPDNSEAKMVKGYAYLKDGELAQAENTFSDLAGKKDDDEMLGKEGLVAVYAAQGQTEKALNLAQEVEQKAPERSYVHVVKGDLLYNQNKKQQAQAEYQQATQKGSAQSYQKALAYNKLGRLYASLEDYEKSRDLYDQAVAIDPYYVEAMANKGVTYEKQGNWDKALAVYQESSNIDKTDMFSAVLAKRAQEMLELQTNAQSKERIDKLVGDLAKRYRSKKKIFTIKKEDSWTSQPMVLTFIDFQETGGLTERDGYTTVLTTQLAEQLNQSGRVQVVERVVLDRLLEELNLGSSDLADQNTALRLGRVLAAKIIGTGSVYHISDGTLLSLRLIDTETTGIAKVINRQIKQGAPLKTELHKLNREILTSVILGYPLKAYVVDVAADKIMINIGSNQGVVAGTKFDVIEEQEPVKYKGKILQKAPETVAQIEVESVEPDLSYCRIIGQTKPVARDDKIVEKIEQEIKG